MGNPQTSRRLVAGNWKMNLDFQQGCDLAQEIVASLGNSEVPVVLCSPAIHLSALGGKVDDTANVYVAAQDVSAHTSGAHTGELSAQQLRSVGCNYVLVGHSERRSDHGEKGALLAQKIKQALEAGLKPIYCFGETLEQRESGQVSQVTANQLSEGLGDLDAASMANVVLAYEPVWAIGTGKTASPEQAQEVHANVRSWLTQRFGESLSASTTILYGGSVKPANASELFGQADIDGGLIGGASLKAKDFLAIVRAFG